MNNHHPKHTEQRLLDPEATFATLCASLNLDPRLRKAVARLGFVRPTLVQSRALPLAIEAGRDLLVRARTGSGKTLAYVLPVLHKVLRDRRDNNNDDDSFVQAVILVPTRELCHQVYDTVTRLCFYCEDVVGCAVLTTATGGDADAKRRHNLLVEATLRDRPDILISTPAGLRAHLDRLTLHTSVHTLVVDEADLVLSFGYAEDVAVVVRALPKICQGMLLSATLSPALEALKRVVLHSPAVLKLEEDRDDRGDGGKLSQFHVTLPKKDKLLIVYVFLKLGLLKGKGLFFVNTTDAGYRLKLFLEQFHIRSAVLNAELPARSRMSIIEQFNADNFDYLIATDESSSVVSRSGKRQKNTDTAKTIDDSAAIDEVAGDPALLEDGSSKVVTASTTTDTNENTTKPSKKTKRRHKDSEYGVSRGMDFRNVSFVLNVDMPADPESYTHRIGRTARGGAKGVALTLVSADSVEDSRVLDAVQSTQPALPLLGGADEDGDVTPLQTSTGDNLRAQPCPLDFNLRELEGFRYRVEDVSRAVTRIAVRETRAAELRAELLNSERLTEHLDANSLHVLRHDRTVTRRVQEHLKNVPSYMLPRGMQVAQTNRKKRRRNHTAGGRGGRGGNNKTDDPLQGNLTSGDDDAVGRAGEDGFFGEEQDDSNNVKGKPVAPVDDRVFMNTKDGTGKGTSGRQAWKMKHKKGRYNKRTKEADGKWD